MSKKFFTITKSLDELGIGSYKELWTKAQADGYDALNIVIPAEIKKADGDDDNLFHAVFSTDNEDRHYDVVKQDFDLKHFKKNPVFLDSHNYDSIVHILGAVKNIKQDKVLEGDIVFALMNPKGLLAREMAMAGFLNATSIGFIPKKFSDKGEILESELLEISAVSVPANPYALLEKAFDEEKKTGEKIITATPSRKSEYARAIASMVKQRNEALKGIAKEVHEMVAENRVDKKRKIFQAVRGLMNQEL